MDRIKQLEQYAAPEYFAYKERYDNNGLTNHEFERIGGSRVLNYCYWNKRKITKLSEEEFNKILNTIKITKTLNDYYENMSLIDFLNSFK